MDRLLRYACHARHSFVLGGTDVVNRRAFPILDVQDLDGPGDGAPCFQQPGRSTDNALSPAYEWKNSCSGAQPDACPGGLGSGNVHFGEDVPQLEESVDYYNYRPGSFDGTGGTCRPGGGPQSMDPGRERGRGRGGAWP